MELAKLAFVRNKGELQGLCCNVGACSGKLTM